MIKINIAPRHQRKNSPIGYIVVKNTVGGASKDNFASYALLTPLCLRNIILQYLIKDMTGDVLTDIVIYYNLISVSQLYVTGMGASHVWSNVDFTFPSSHTSSVMLMMVVNQHAADKREVSKIMVTSVAEATQCHNDHKHKAHTAALPS